ncbi:MAG: MFS transporter [Deltaproteobacteria bacterium]|nr:MFS transporter [Deltaproteobacteria bacterium]
MEKILNKADQRKKYSYTPGGSVFLLAGLTVAHGIFHFMAQSFSVMLPAIKETFGISAVQIGAIITARELAAGMASFPGGVVSDYLRRYRGLLMASCMVMFALGWWVIGISPVYPLLLAGMVMVASAGSIWHLPSLAELSLQFSRRRGAALAVHGVGGSLGDIFGPMITGLLLGVLSWRGIISMYAALPLIMACWVTWAFRGLGNQKSRTVNTRQLEEADIRLQFKITKHILKQTHIWRVNVVAGLRGMCFDIFVTFLPLFMKEKLGFSSQSIGFHFGLLWTVGIIASPVMGHLSDRFGRKPILIPALAYSTVLTLMLALFGKGFLFTLIIVFLGISIRSDYSILSATILDIAGDKVATTMLGILSFSRFIMAAISPLIAGALYQYLGMQAALFFVAALFASSGIIFALTDLNKTAMTAISKS